MLKDISHAGAWAMGLDAPLQSLPPRATVSSPSTTATTSVPVPVHQNQNGWAGAPLFTHQVVMVNAMREMERRRDADTATLPPTSPPSLTTFTYDCGMLASASGSGKTLTSIALAALHPHVQDGDADARASRKSVVTRLMGRAVVTQTHRFEFCFDSTLVVVPSSLLKQWIDAFVDMARLPKDDLVIFTRFTVSERDRLMQMCARSPTMILMTNTAYASFVSPRHHLDFHGLCVFQRTIYDEADTLNVSNFAYANAHFSWLVTASPRRVVMQKLRSRGMRIGGPSLSPSWYEFPDGYLPANVHRQLKVNTETWDALTVSCDDAFVAESVALPALRRSTVHVRRQALQDALHSAIPVHAAEALEAGDVAGAIEAVGCSAVASEEGIVAAVTTKLQESIRVLEGRRAYYDTMLSYHDPQSIVRRMTVLGEIDAKIASVRLNIDRIRTRVSESDNVCPITMEEISTCATTPCCQNTFECAALFRALQASGGKCPMCRHTQLLPVDIVVLKLRSEDDGNDDTEMADQMRRRRDDGSEAFPFDNIYAALEHSIRGILRERPDAKILVFSAHPMDTTAHGQRNIFTAVRDGLSGRHSFKCLKGTCATVNKTVDTFRKGGTAPSSASAPADGDGGLLPLRVLLLNAIHLGAGLNLEFATHVLTLHSMPVDLYRQVVGRAQRSGRTEPLSVLDIRMVGMPVHTATSASTGASTGASTSASTSASMIMATNEA